MTLKTYLKLPSHSESKDISISWLARVKRHLEKYGDGSIKIEDDLVVVYLDYLPTKGDTISLAEWEFKVLKVNYLIPSKLTIERCAFIDLDITNPVGGFYT